jgi:hypothetical protein
MSGYFWIESSVGRTETGRSKTKANDSILDSRPKCDMRLKQHHEFAKQVACLERMEFASRRAEYEQLTASHDPYQLWPRGIELAGMCCLHVSVENVDE